MKVWLVNHYAVAPDQPGGTRHYGLATALAERGHEPTVIAANFAHDTRTYGNRARKRPMYQLHGTVPFLWLPTPTYGGHVRRLWNMLVFALQVRFNRAVRFLAEPDVIVGSSLTLFAALAALRLARRLRVPFVLEVRDVWPQTLIDFGISRFHPIVLLFGVVEWYLYREADAVITLLPGAKRHMRAHGAGDKQIVWLPNGVDLQNAPQPAPPEAKRQFDVLYAGSHAPGDALECLLQAALLLQQRERSDIRLRLIGNGSSKRELQQLAQTLQLGNVVFEDPVAKREIYRELARADALVVTLQDVGVYRFGISLNKLYDYMASARPVIFAGHALNDAVSESGCGLVVSPQDPEALANAIEQLAAMPVEQRWELGVRGRRYVEAHHDFRVLAGKLEGLLMRVVAGNTCEQAAAGYQETRNAATAQAND